METKEIIRNFYNKGVQFEWNRLERHPIEFEITKKFLNKYIKQGDHILDIGGGPGRYSFFLAEKGCDVTLLDLSDENVLFAQNKSVQTGIKIKAIQGDACDANAKIDGTFDSILLMGPMYHLLKESARIKAVNSALTLLKKGGVIFISFISLYAGFIYFMKEGPQLILESSEKEYIDSFLKNETYCGDSFTKACFVALKDICPFMMQFPLEKLHVFGQEGITSPCENNIKNCSCDVIDKWIDIATSICEREEFLAYSEHIMYVGRKK